jgi:hypothetical protein
MEVTDDMYVTPKAFYTGNEGWREWKGPGLNLLELIERDTDYMYLGEVIIELTFGGFQGTVWHEGSGFLAGRLPSSDQVKFCPFIVKDGDAPKMSGGFDEWKHDMIYDEGMKASFHGK